MASIHDFSFSFSRFHNPETDREESCLKIGPKTIQATFSTDPVAPGSATLKRNGIVLAGDEGAVVVKVQELARALNMDEPSLEDLFSESDSIDIGNLKELALFVDVSKIDQSCFDNLSPCMSHNVTVRLRLAEKLIGVGKKPLIIGNLETFGYTEEIAKLLIREGMGRNVAANLEKFGFSVPKKAEIADLLIEKGKVIDVFSYFKKFDLDDDMKLKIAEILMEKMGSWFVADKIHLFGYTEGMAKLLIRKGCCLSIMTNSEKFDCYNEEIARLLIERKYGGFVASAFEKFGFDTRKVQYSSLILTNQMKRDEALNKLKQPAITASEAKKDFEYIATKLGINVKELQTYMDSPIKSHKDYKNMQSIFNFGAKVMKVLGLERSIKR